MLLTVFVERARVRNTGKLAAQVMNDLRVRVFAHIQRLSLDYFTDEKAGVIMTRMTSDIEVLQQLLQDGLAQFAIQGLTMVFVDGDALLLQLEARAHHRSRSSCRRSSSPRCGSGLRPSAPTCGCATRSPA